MITGNESINTLYAEADGMGGTSWNGLTIRQHFAAMAMQGIVSKPNAYTTPEEYAKYAVELADALITELNKTA